MINWKRGWTVWLILFLVCVGFLALLTPRPAPELSPARPLAVEPAPVYHLICPPLYACASVYYQVVGEPFYSAFQRLIHTPICLHGECITVYKRLLYKRLPGILAVLFLLTVGVQADMHLAAQSPVYILNIGDSRMDEYYPPAEDAASRDGCPASLPGCLSFGWVEQLAYFRGSYVSYGQAGNWAFPRRHGLEYNLALSGVAFAAVGRVTSAIGNTNFLGTVDAIYASRSQFDIIFIGLGANDFATYNGGYDDVATGRVSVSQKSSAIVTAFNGLMARVRAHAPTTPVYIHLVPANMTDQFAAAMGYSAAQRALAMQAMTAVNDALNAYRAGDPNAFTVDFESAFRAPYIALGADGFWNYLGYHINFFQACDDPRICGSTAPASAPHPGIWGEGMIANWHLNILNQALGRNIPPLTDQEMLQLAGLIGQATPAPPATDTPIPPTIAPTPTITATPVPALTNTPTPVPTADAPPYIVIHRPGVADTIYYLPPGYARVSGYCAFGNSYMGIKEPGATLRKYVCWSE